jgi:hypothetical protein
MAAELSGYHDDINNNNNGFLSLLLLSKTIKIKYTKLWRWAKKTQRRGPSG